MAWGWQYTKLFLSSSLLLSFPGMCFVFCFVLCSRWSFVDASLIFSCPEDHVPDWQPRILLGMVDARSVNVKNTHTINHNTYEVGAYNWVKLPPISVTPRIS